MELSTELFHKAVVWAETCAADIISNGFPLSSPKRAIASRIGVNDPEKTRIMLVKIIPRPTDPELVQLVDKYSLLGDNTAGLTVGYGIYLREDAFCNQILSHELRHVYQYEQAGTIENFLMEYIPQILQFGYHHAPLELDAHEYELFGI